MSSTIKTSDMTSISRGPRESRHQFSAKTRRFAACWHEIRILGAMLILSGSVAATDVSMETSANVSVLAGGFARRELSEFGTVESALSEDHEYEDFGVRRYAGATAQTYASAAAGVMKLGAWATAYADPKATPFGLEPFAAASAGGHVRYTDRFTIENPDLAGQRGSAQLSLYLPGSIRGSSSWAKTSWGAQFGFSITFPGGGGFTADPQAYSAGLGFYERPSTLPEDGWIDLDLEFTYGRPIDFSLFMSAFSTMQARDGTSGAASVDFAHSLYWGGLGDFKVGAAAVDPEKVSVSSPSGINYLTSFVPTESVPEGGCAIGMLAGATGLLFLVRRRDLNSKTLR